MQPQHSSSLSYNTQHINANVTVLPQSEHYLSRKSRITPLNTLPATDKASLPRNMGQKKKKEKEKKWSSLTQEHPMWIARHLSFLFFWAPGCSTAPLWRWISPSFQLHKNLFRLVFTLSSSNFIPPSKFGSVVQVQAKTSNIFWTENATPLKENGKQRVVDLW